MVKTPSFKKAIVGINEDNGSPLRSIQSKIRNDFLHENMGYVISELSLVLNLEIESINQKNFVLSNRALF
ncbi:hypothetical protein AXF22_02320 [Prevotella scopos JCM 17725]|nr:hypothetical protein AXF22_02320 [Prevotella scopos JCM 17725]